MARYEEMDEIVSRLRRHLDTDSKSPVSAPPLDDRTARRKPLIGIANPGFEQAAELMTRILRDAERARDMLGDMPEESLTAGEQEILASLGGRARKELWRCENALGRLGVFE